MAKRKQENPLPMQEKSNRMNGNQMVYMPTLESLLSFNNNGIEMKDFIDMFSPYYVCYFGMYMYSEDLRKYLSTSKYPFHVHKASEIFKRHLNMISETLIEKINLYNIKNFDMPCLFKKLLEVIKEPIFIHVLVFFGLLLSALPMTEHGKRFQEEGMVFCLKINDLRSQETMRQLVRKNSVQMSHLLVNPRINDSFRQSEKFLRLSKFNQTNHLAKHSTIMRNTLIPNRDNLAPLIFNYHLNRPLINKNNRHIHQNSESNIPYEQTFKNLVNCLYNNNNNKTHHETMSNNYLLKSSSFTNVAETYPKNAQHYFKPPIITPIETVCHLNVDTEKKFVPNLQGPSCTTISSNNSVQVNHVQNNIYLKNEPTIEQPMNLSSNVKINLPMGRSDVICLDSDEENSNKLMNKLEDFKNDKHYVFSEDIRKDVVPEKFVCFCGSNVQIKCMCEKMYCSRDCQVMDWQKHKLICPKTFKVDL